MSTMAHIAHIVATERPRPKCHWCEAELEKGSYYRLEQDFYFGRDIQWFDPPTRTPLVFCGLHCVGYWIDGLRAKD